MGKFILPKTESKSNKSIRFPNDMIEAVEKALIGKQCTFSAFVIAAVQAALDDINKK